MRPLLCASLEAATTAELCASRDGVDPAVDLIELRLDSVEDPNVGRVLKGCKRPVIVTCRPTWEGGRFNGSEEERHRILASHGRIHLGTFASYRNRSCFGLN